MSINILQWTPGIMGRISVQINNAIFVYYNNVTIMFWSQTTMSGDIMQPLIKLGLYEKTLSHDQMH